MRPSASPLECRHGRLEAVGAGGSSAPKAKQPPAGLHGGRREEGQREGRMEGREGAEEKFGSEKQRFCSAGACISDRDWVTGRQDWFLARGRGIP